MSEQFLAIRWTLLRAHPEVSLEAVIILSAIHDQQKTYGRATITNGEFADYTRSSVSFIAQELKSLEKQGLLIRERDKRNYRRLTLTAAGKALAAVFASGSAGEAAVASVPPPTQTVTAEQPPAPKKDKKDRKRNPTAEEHCARELPDYIPREVWTEFINVRQAEHGPFSEVSATQLVNKIGTLRAEGHDPVKLLRRAMLNCWKSVFPDDRGKETRASAPDPRDFFGGHDHIRGAKRS